jgi:RimJ/RimL family protein N-acetyltransferase
VLRGEHVVLRAVERDDVPQLHAWGRDHAEWTRVSAAAYQPRTLGDELKAYDEGKTWRADDKRVPFAVEVAGALVGSVALWGIDLHNRHAHLGIGLGPDARGKGYGSDTCRVLLRYAFSDRGLHRVQLEVLASNEEAIRAYRAVGFVEEGRTRDSGWVEGGFEDEVIMSVLSTESAVPLVTSAPGGP